MQKALIIFLSKIILKMEAYLCSESCSCVVHTPGDRHIYRGPVPIVTVSVFTGHVPYLCSGSCSCVVHSPGDRHIYRARTY